MGGERKRRGEGRGGEGRGGEGKRRGGEGRGGERKRRGEGKGGERKRRGGGRGEEERGGEGREGERKRRGEGRGGERMRRGGGRGGEGRGRGEGRGGERTRRGEGGRGGEGRGRGEGGGKGEEEERGGGKGGEGRGEEEKSREWRGNMGVEEIGGRGGLMRASVGPAPQAALTLLGILHSSDVSKVGSVGYAQSSHAIGMLPLREVALEGLGSPVSGVPTDLTGVAQVEAMELVEPVWNGLRGGGTTQQVRHSHHKS